VLLRRPEHRLQSVADITGLDRQNANTANFAKAYGADVRI
jgi:hypothetical protein